MARRGTGGEQGAERSSADRQMPASKDIGATLDVGFKWRDREQAAHPGERGRIHVPAQSQAV